MREISAVIGTEFYGICVRGGFDTPATWFHQGPAGRVAAGSRPVLVQRSRAMATVCAVFCVKFLSVKPILSLSGAASQAMGVVRFVILIISENCAMINF